MKRLLVILALSLVGLLSGCSTVDTAEERNRRLLQIGDLQWRMFVDDMDYFWLTDRNTNLTSWHPRVGS